MCDPAAGDVSEAGCGRGRIRHATTCRQGCRDTIGAARTATMRLTCLAGLAGAPVVVLPLANDAGLPRGVAHLGAPGTDRSLLRWAADRMATG